MCFGDMECFPIIVGILMFGYVFIQATCDDYDDDDDDGVDADDDDDDDRLLELQSVTCVKSRGNGAGGS